MKVNTTATLYGLDRQPLKAPAPTTFREAVSNALGAVDSKAISPVKQLRLAMRIQDQDEVELDGEDKRAVNACCAAVFAPLVAGQIESIMEDGKSLLGPAVKKIE